MGSESLEYTVIFGEEEEGAKQSHDRTVTIKRLFFDVPAGNLLSPPASRAAIPSHEFGRVGSFHRDATLGAEYFRRDQFVIRH